MIFGKKSKENENGAAAASDNKASVPPAKAGAPAGPAQPTLHPEEAKRRAAAAKHLAAAFGEIVTLLMRAPGFKGQTLADLEWLLAPALVSGQFTVATAQSKANGAIAPAGAVLWARVSEEVDKRLAAAPLAPLRLAPKEWTSGDIGWVVACVGDGRVLKEMVARLQAKEWAGKVVKAVALGKDGKPAVGTLSGLAA
jgi:hemolysin-activating ACP:hemolysin acyltransferase